VIGFAEEAGLTAVALTDHNTTKGLSEFVSSEKDHPDIELVAGCEFTTEFEKKEVHIVGLFLPEDSWTAVEEYVVPMKKSKHGSNITLIKKLREGGFDIKYDEVMALTDADEFNRAHVARLLYKKGYVQDIKEAFDKLLFEGGGYFYPPERPDVFKTISFIRKCDAIPVLAHPYLNLDEDEIRRMIPEAKKAGLLAMETRYSKYSEQTTKRAAAAAAGFGLLESGGSDFHGDAKPNVSIGTGKGDLTVPYSFFEKLSAAL
jgi:predicted metal-dependent phosphoesterase TrpH